MNHILYLVVVTIAVYELEARWMPMRNRKCKGKLILALFDKMIMSLSLILSTYF